MPTSVQRKHYPLSLRLPEADLALIDRAAKKQGRSRTDFMRDAAVREAEATMLESAMIQMSAAGFASFVEAIEAPAKVNEKLLQALQRTPIRDWR